MNEQEIDLSQLPEEQPQQLVETEEPAEPIPEADVPVTPEAEEPTEPATETETVLPAEEPAKPREKKRRSKTWVAILACGLAFAALATSVFGLWAVAAVNEKWQEKYDRLIDTFDYKLSLMDQKIDDTSYTGQGNSVSGSNNVSSGGLTPGQVYAQCVSSVVAISSQGITTNIYGQASQTASTGSGFIFSANGYVVTNAHVVEGATKLTVITYQGTEYNAVLVGADSTNDLAVLKIEATGLQPAKIGSSNKLIVGDQVAAIGNPLGELTNTLTVGYISAKERSVNTEGAMINMLQTDASINPGNSGGPLFNMKGEVIGITTAKFSGTTTSGASIEGVGFAIPIDDVTKKIENLIAYGIVSPAYLGVTVTDVSLEVSQAYGIPMGARVKETEPQGAAHKGGIQASDVITAIGAMPVTSVNTLTQALLHHQPGDTVTVQVWRSGTVLELQVILGRNPAITD